VPSTAGNASSQQFGAEPPTLPDRQILPNFIFASGRYQIDVTLGGPNSHAAA